MVFVPVNNEIHADYCKELAAKLQSEGLRVRVDDSNETMGKKTRTLQKAKVPFMAVIGDKEIEDKAIALRPYGSRETDVLSLEEAIDKFRDLNNERFPQKLKEL